MDKKETLKYYFGHEDFRGGQEMMVDALLAGRDVLGIMPTGAGKSMCYQIPSLMMQGVALVVSPLISLMKDQVFALKSAGVPAAYLNSSLTPRQIDLAIERARMGAYRIIYVAPERLETYAFRQFAANTKLSLIAVDEAHCISQWGQDFRPSYLRIAEFIRSLPVRPPVGAFTATATERVKADIIKLLELQSPVTATTGFDRPNLFFEVDTPKSKYEALRAILQTKRGESGIVYCATRKNVDEVTEKLDLAGFSVSKYHAGMGEAERVQNQEDFQFDRTQVMVATNAFGMGIDKSNVRFVIHYNMPKSMEAYYQEAGRAGRDGEKSECILLYSGQDIITAKWMIQNGEKNEAMTEEEQQLIRRQDMIRLNQMADYAKNPHCLRNHILHYFGQQAPASCGACSYCIGARYGFVNDLERPSRGRSNGYTYYDKPELFPTKPKTSPVVEEKKGNGDTLFEALRQERLKISKELRLPPYVVCDDKTLTDMAAKQPQNLEQMMAVYGMGVKKVGKFGQAFLHAIRQYNATHKNQPAKVTTAASMATMGKKTESTVAEKAGKPWTEQEDTRLRLSSSLGRTVKEMSEEFGRTASAVRSRLRHLGLWDLPTPVSAAEKTAEMEKRWTIEEEAYLRDGYLAERTIQELSRELDRSTSAIRARLVQMGMIQEESLRAEAATNAFRAGLGKEKPVKKQLESAGQKWTQEEEERLREGFLSGKTVLELSRSHQRTPNGIRARLMKLHLLKEDE